MQTPKPQTLNLQPQSRRTSGGARASCGRSCRSAGIAFHPPLPTSGRLHAPFSPATTVCAWSPLSVPPFLSLSLSPPLHPQIRLLQEDGGVRARCGRDDDWWVQVGGNPQPSTLNSQPSTPQPSTLDTQPSTLNPQPSTLNPQPSTLNPQP